MSNQEAKGRSGKSFTYSGHSPRKEQNQETDPATLLKGKRQTECTGTSDHTDDIEVGELPRSTVAAVDVSIV